MKLSLNWLADYVDLSGLTPDMIAEKLTMNAFEVEGVHTFGSDLTGPIVVGEILDIQPHPDPKVTKMRVTKTRVAEGQEPLQIVCGATNIAVGQRIPVALPGSIVINRHDGSAFPITVTDKRGVQSNGMLCAATELGITDGDSEGILILDPPLTLRLGADIEDLLCLTKDYVLTVASRSNRGDAVCVRGLAREVAALFKRPMREPEWQLKENPDKSKYNFSIQIDDVKDCESFTIRTIGNLKVASSPPFIARRLAAVGTRSINNLVDITNYVMHEWGQPMHAYDAAAVKDGKFHVRRGKSGEKYTTLDGKERILSPEMLIISDTEKVIGMPIMGGANSEINDKTTDIALEAASFSPAIVRRSSRLLGLSSESALRFERGIDAATTKQASDRAAYLISKYCTGDGPVKIGTFVASGKGECTPVHIELRKKEIVRHLNLDLPTNEVKDLLNRLEFTPIDSKSTQDKLVFSIPSFRQSDVRREIDLIEEIARVYGYDNIEEESPAFFTLANMPENINTAIRKVLIGEGLCEAYITSLIPDQTTSNGNAASLTEKGKYLSSHDNSRSVKVLNPLSPEHQTLRQTLLPGLINALKYNFDRGEENVWLFELGFTYLTHSTKEKCSEPALEEGKVAGILSGNRQLSLWKDASDNSSNNKSNTNKLNFYDAKGMLENLFQSLHICASAITYAKEEQSPALMHPGQSAHIICATDNGAIEIGWLGQLHPASVQDLGLDSQTYLFELNIDTLKALRKKPSFEAISTLPAISRDLTVDLSNNTENASVITCVEQAAINLKNIDLVSIFPLDSGKRSLSYRLTFQSNTETLKSEDIEQTMNTIRSKLTEKLNASFRV